MFHPATRPLSSSRGGTSVASRCKSKNNAGTTYWRNFLALDSARVVGIECAVQLGFALVVHRGRPTEVPRSWGPEPCSGALRFGPGRVQRPQWQLLRIGVGRDVRRYGVRRVGERFWLIESCSQSSQKWETGRVVRASPLTQLSMRCPPIL